MNPIKLARLRKGLTQAELAEIMKVSVGAISQWETGISHPSARRLKPLAETLDTTVDALVS